MAGGLLYFLKYYFLHKKFLIFTIIRNFFDNICAEFFSEIFLPDKIANLPEKNIQREGCWPAL